MQNSHTHTYNSARPTHPLTFNGPFSLSFCTRLCPAPVTPLPPAPFKFLPAPTPRNFKDRCKPVLVARGLVVGALDPTGCDVTFISGALAPLVVEGAALIGAVSTGLVRGRSISILPSSKFGDPLSFVISFMRCS